jgi:hypothetical protein
MPNHGVTRFFGPVRVDENTYVRISVAAIRCHTPVQLAHRLKTQPLCRQYNTSLLIVTARFDEPSQVRQKTSHLYQST